MRRWWAGLVVASMGVAACGGGGEGSPVGAGGSPGPVATTPVPASPTPASTPTRSPVRDATERTYSSAVFSRSATVDNRWFPLTPGVQRTYVNQVEGSARTVATATDVIKTVNGVDAAVVLEVDYGGDEKEEVSLALYAQDDDGTVWELGEYPEEYVDGRLAGASSTWLAGARGASPGVIMRAQPRTGAPSYRHGSAPAIQLADRAEVARTGHRECVPAGCYTDAVLVEEWEESAPEDRQRKSFAPEVGLVRDRAEGEEPEDWRLTTVRTLDPAALAKVRAEALALDQRAYTVAKPVWGSSTRAQSAAG